MKVTLTIISSLLLIVLSCMIGLPKYNVWTSKIAIETATNDGAAALAKAAESRQIAIEEAKAQVLVDSLEAIGEVFRAQGIAAAMEIEDGKLTDRYIKYLFVRNINKMREGDRIYIPTEAGLPILEARPD